MAIRYPETIRDARLTQVKNAMDAGAAAGTIKVYTGGQPANADTAASGTLLATFTCADPAFTGPTAGVLTLDADPDLTAVAADSGDAGWARAADSDGTTVFDGSVSLSGGGGDFIISALAITSGQTVTLTEGTLTDPAS